MVGVQIKGNPPAQGDADHVRGLELERVHERSRVPGHLRDRIRLIGLVRSTGAAIVERQQR